jgi:hypothetical protein
MFYFVRFNRSRSDHPTNQNTSSLSSGQTWRRKQKQHKLSIRQDKYSIKTWRKQHATWDCSTAQYKDDEITQCSEFVHNHFLKIKFLYKTNKQLLCNFRSGTAKSDIISLRQAHWVDSIGLWRHAIGRRSDHDREHVSALQMPPSDLKSIGGEIGGGIWSVYPHLMTTKKKRKKINSRSKCNDR